MLTQKQEQFAQNIFIGMTQREAYKKAYDAKNMSDKTIDEKACILCKNDKVKTRIEELRGKVADKNIMDAKERMQWLSNLITGRVPYISSDGESKTELAEIKDKLKAMDILNKMDGQYTQEIKLDTDGELNVTIKVVE